MRFTRVINEKAWGVRSTLPPPTSARVNPRRTYRFSTYTPAEGGGGWGDSLPLAVWPLIELEFRGKKRACRALRDAATDT